MREIRNEGPRSGGGVEFFMARRDNGPRAIASDARSRSSATWRFSGRKPVAGAPSNSERFTLDLGREILWARDRLSHHVRRMKQRGLIAHDGCGDDDPGTMIRLTPAGWAPSNKPTQTRGRNPQVLHGPGGR